MKYAKNIILCALLFVLTAAFTDDDASGFIHPEKMSIDSFFEQFSKNSVFSCSLSINEYSSLDTTEYDGFLALDENSFFSRLGDDFYLQNDGQAMLTWSEGSDALEADGMPFFDFNALKIVLEDKFALVASHKKQEYCIEGGSRDKQAVIARWHLCMDENFSNIKLNIFLANGDKVFIKFYRINREKPDKSYFQLPAGVSIFR